MKVGDPTTARRAISAGVTRFGRIDALVNNAGIYIGKPFTEHTAEDYAAVMNVNMTSFYHITQLAVTEMLVASLRPEAQRSETISE